MARAEPMSQHGWFPDPEEPGRLRMWDGAAWTSLTKYPSVDDVVSGPPPSGPLPAPSSALAAPAQRPATRPSPRPAPSRPAPAPGPLSAQTAAPATRPRDPADAPALTVMAVNLYSVITLFVALICILVASTTGFVVIGVLPVLLALRAFGVREPMAPIAGLAAAATAVIALVLLAK